MPNGNLHYDSHFWSSQPTPEELFSSIDEHLAGGGTVADHEVRRAVYHAFFDARVPDPANLPEDEVDLVFGPSAVTGRSVREIANQAALCGSRSYFLTPYAMSREVHPNPYDEFGYESYTLHLPGAFVDLAMELKPYLLDGCVQIVPRASTFVSSEGRAYTNSRHPGLLDVALGEEVAGSGMDRGASALEIPLKAVTGPPDRVLEVRREHREQFRSFQAALAGMIATRPEQGEAALSESMQRVEEEVRRLDEQMERLRRERRFEMAKLAVTPVSVLLPFLLPPPLGAVVAVAFAALGGGGGAIELVQHLSKRRRALEEIRGDPFYIPWLLQEE